MNVTLAPSPGAAEASIRASPISNTTKLLRNCHPVGGVPLRSPNQAHEHRSPPPLSPRPRSPHTSDTAGSTDPGPCGLGSIVGRRCSGLPSKPTSRVVEHPCPQEPHDLLPGTGRHGNARCHPGTGATITQQPGTASRTCHPPTGATSIMNRSSTRKAHVEHRRAAAQGTAQTHSKLQLLPLKPLCRKAFRAEAATRRCRAVNPKVEGSSPSPGAR